MPTPDTEVTLAGEAESPFTSGAPEAPEALDESVDLSTVRTLLDVLGVEEAARLALIAQIQALQLSGVTRVEIPEEFQAAVRATDHTLLDGATPQGIWDLCVEAAKSNPYPNSVCVQGEFVALAREFLRLMGCPSGDEGVKVCAVGQRHFPRTTLNPVQDAGYDVAQLPGTAPLNDKLADLREALAAGAEVFDMVQDASLVLDTREGTFQAAVDEIQTMRDWMDENGHRNKPLRVICSTGMLRAIGGRPMLDRACAIVSAAAAGFSDRPGAIVMKTETGFILDPVKSTADKPAKYAATPLDVTVMRTQLPDWIGIKASGGVSEASANDMMHSGANFLGASGFLRGLLKRLKQPARSGDTTDAPAAPTY